MAAPSPSPLRDLCVEYLARLAHEPTLGIHYVCLHIRKQLGHAVASVTRRALALHADASDTIRDLHFSQRALTTQHASAAATLARMSASIDHTLMATRARR